ncbi:hypothetical protein JAAARDRAFT_39726 [Jaapia argillacea MUCL 33604]|uniref:G domain-containing protein n=1 Tax=Jaapia argillacea MUCL 33604 TaxID=933084 RepID=A0A067PNY4_9AGAM|nr:hypothetical protein JAAARDRAFT_39726 [Jaapia argillacea MUCL 33604]
MVKSDIDVGAVIPNDIVIAIMGPTGSGKSNFVDTLMKQKGTRDQRSGKSLKSCTDKVQAVQLPPALVTRHLPGTTERVVLVDTPGFDDTNKTDMDILNMIGIWLEKTYKKQVKLAGIIYLHRISDNRMSGSPHKNLRMFGKLCGDTAAHRVVLVSTMWDTVDPGTAEKREVELRDNFWKGMLDNRASYARFHNTTDSSWEIVNTVVRSKEAREVLLLQEELVDLQKRLNETEAGKALYTVLQKALSDQQETIRRLLADQASQANPELAKQLESEHARVQKELDATFVQIKRLKIPVGRRIILLFKFKKARGRAV